MAAVEGEEVVAVVCHVQNGNVLLQAPMHAAEIALAAVRESGRKVRGLIGPLAQVEEARGALGLTGVPATFEIPEVLYALAVNELVVPGGEWECRVVTPEDFEEVALHRAEYVVEAIGEQRSEKTLPEAREAIQRGALDRSQFVLRVGGRPVSSGCFNARLPDVVQLGGIFTPRSERGKGHARRLVAGMLQQAGAEGVTRAVLFTAQDNVAAQRAYEALGFRRVGDYGLLLWPD